MKERVVMCWSGGKDSALALHALQRNSNCEVVALLTTCSEHFQRVSMHGVRIELLERQAEALGLPLEKVFVGQSSTNEDYAAQMATAFKRYQSRGVTSVAYGDIFLEDLRRWRVEQLKSLGLRGLFPLWQQDTWRLIKQFLRDGFESVLCCVNDAWLDERAVGRNLDEELIVSLPAGVDPCGENGEFHSFAFAGPVFKQPVRFSVGEKVYRPLGQTHPTSGHSVPATGHHGRTTRGFWFCDLLPA